MSVERVTADVRIPIRVLGVKYWKKNAFSFTDPHQVTSVVGLPDPDPSLFCGTDPDLYKIRILPSISKKVKKNSEKNLLFCCWNFVIHRRQMQDPDP